MILEEKVCIGKVLEWMQVDVIEVGFVIVSQGDFEFVKVVVDII